ncbi:MAG: hypothetical protein WD929_04135 [Steroidobacteraceae bacterium]
MKRSVALLFGLLVLAVQTASLTHEHAAETLPTGQQVQACDFCTGLQASAPPPASVGVAHHAVAPPHFQLVSATQSLPSRPTGAHRSRAPPSLRSI